MGGSNPVAEITYFVPASPAYYTAELDLSIVRNGAGTAFRAGASVGAWDPTPLPDSAHGKRLRVLPSSGCPKTNEGAVGVTNPQFHLTTSLIPTAVPSRGLICWYKAPPFRFGTPPRPYSLVASQPLNSSQVRNIASTMVAFPIGRPDYPYSTNCPAALFENAIIALEYPGGKVADVFWADSGCQTMANGYILQGNIPGLDITPPAGAQGF